MASSWSSGPNITRTKPAVRLFCEWNCYIVITRLKGAHRLSNETEKWTTQFAVSLSLTYPLTVVSVWLLCREEKLPEPFPSKHQLSPDQRRTCHSPSRGPLAPLKRRAPRGNSYQRVLLLRGCLIEKGSLRFRPPMFGYLLPLFTNSITSSHGSPRERYELLILLTHCASAKGRLETNELVLHLSGGIHLL